MPDPVADPSGIPPTSNTPASTTPAVPGHPGLRPWVRGQSGNPHGRPKGSRGLPALIASLTHDGRTLIERLHEIAFAPDTEPQHAIAAIRELLNRGFGKPLEAIEISGPDGGPIQTVQQPYDLARLSPDQALRLRELLLAARRPVIEGESSEVQE